jgi:hypothetical protein
MIFPTSDIHRDGHPERRVFDQQPGKQLQFEKEPINFNSVGTFGMEFLAVCIGLFMPC